MIDKQRLLAHAAQVEEWARARNLIDGSDPKSQTLKTVSEFGELAVAVFDGDDAETVDGIGDVLVTQIIVCAQLGVSFESAIVAAENMVTQEPKRAEYILLCTGLLGKMADNVLKGQKEGFHYNLVKFIHYMEMAFDNAFDIAGCLGMAYDEIKDRRGVMYNGAFIKSTDPAYATALAEL